MNKCTKLAKCPRGHAKTGLSCFKQKQCAVDQFCFELITNKLDYHYIVQIFTVFSL